MKPQKFTLKIYARRRFLAQTRGYPIPKWVDFCAQMVDLGFHVTFIDAKSTVSKYVYVSKGVKVFKVRFSNHKPNPRDERKKTSDFYVGVSNFGVTTTEDAIKAIKKYFNTKENKTHEKTKTHQRSKSYRGSPR